MVQHVPVGRLYCPKIFSHGVGVFSSMVDASFTRFGSLFAIESDVTFTLHPPFLDTLASRLLDTVFRLPSWSIMAYSGLALITNMLLYSRSESYCNFPLPCDPQWMLLVGAVQRRRIRPLQSMARIGPSCRSASRIRLMTF